MGNNYAQDHRYNESQLVGTSSANTAVTVTKAAGGAGVRHLMFSLSVCGRAAAVAAAGASIVVTDGSTVIWRGAITANMPVYNFRFANPLIGSANTALNIDVAAAGASCVVEVAAEIGTVS